MKIPASLASRNIGTTLEFAPVVTAARPSSDGRSPGNTLANIIRPQIRDRWTSLILRGLTPDRVEQILRGALTGDLVSQWELFDLMEDTWPRLKKNLNEVKEQVQTTKLHIVPYVRSGADDPSPRATQKAALLQAAMLSTLPDVTRDENCWEEAIYDLCDAFGKGMCLQEVMWNRGLIEGKPAIVPRAFRWVHPRHYGFPWSTIQDGEDRLMLSPSGDYGDWVEFPAHKFLIGRFKTKTGHLLGAALLRSLATFWIGATFSYDWALNLAQMFGIPIRWANYDSGDSKLLDEICDMLENLGSAGWGAFPAGTTLQLHEAVQRAADNPQAFVMNLADVAADILILGQTLTTSAGDKGTQALGTVHKSVRDERLDYVALWAAETMNYQFVPSLMLLNFGDNDEDPWLEPQTRVVKDAKSMAERDEILSKLGIAVPKKWFYERHEIPMPKPEEEVLTLTASAPQAEEPTPGEDDPHPGQKPDASKTKPAIKAKAAPALPPQNQLLRNALAMYAGVAPEYLAPIDRWIANIENQAKEGSLTDTQFLDLLERASNSLPELFTQIDHDALADVIEKATGTAALRGAVAAMRKKPSRS